MKRKTTASLAEDMIKVDHALLASMKNLRAVATRLHQNSGDATERGQLEKIIARRVPIVPKSPIKPKSEGVLDSNLPFLRFRKVLPRLSEGQLQLLMDLARSLAKRRSTPGAGS